MELQTFNHQNTITSMEVAEMIERQHNELLKQFGNISII